MIEIVNRQNRIKVEIKEFLLFADSARNVISRAAESRFDVAFVSDRRMRVLNKRFRGKDSTTDVLSFPSESSPDFLGDIAVSVEQAQRQAEENGLTLENEIKQLILHGLLHLCGYDHETDGGEMNKLELKLRKKLGI